MFDTVLGLPVHALVVHAVVVLLPLMAAMTVAVVLVPRWRGAAWYAAAGDALVLGIALVARQSGKTFQHRLGGQIAQTHGREGAVLPWFAFGLLVAAVLFAWARSRGRGALMGSAALVLVAAAATTVWTVVVGHSGATAVWQGIVQSTNGTTAGH